MRFRHVLLTMFNRRLGGRAGFPSELELDDDWLRRRWELFTTYTVPSVAAQSESDFTWVVLCHPESPAWLTALTATIDVPAEVHFSFRHQDPALTRFQDGSADALFVSRIDSDDSWHRRAMERVREDCEADPFTSEIVTLTDGYLLDHQEQQMRPYHHFSPPFSTKISFEPDQNLLDTGGNHRWLRRRFPSRSISDGEPMFLSVQHGTNSVQHRSFEAADPRWLSIGATAEILDRDFSVTLTGSADGGIPATPNGPARRPQAGAPRKPLTRATRPGGPRQRVVVSVPCFRAWSSVARAVESVLDQDHRDLLVILANDGDVNPRWDLVSHLDDPRLVRVDYTTSRGRYFADQVVLMARLGQYLLVQHADGWSEQSRVSALLEEMRRCHSIAAVSAYREHGVNSSDPSAVVRPALAPSPVTPLYRGGLDHLEKSAYHALFDAPGLLNVGGCYGGHRVGYETFLFHLMRMTGTISRLDRPLYHRAGCSGSSVTGTPERPPSALLPEAVGELAGLYQEAYHVYCEYLQGVIGFSQLGRQLRALAWRHVTASEWDALRDEAHRLRWHVQTARAGSRA